MKTFILIDLANTFFRARHTVRGDAELKVGMAFHVTLHSIKKAWQDFKGSHIVICLEGRSWRKDFYEPYKRNRADARAALSPKDAEEDKMFWEAFDALKTFFIEKTNCTVLHNPVLEADDLIAGWVLSHPTDNHVIVSTDGDFAQLVSPTVKQYNGVSGVTVTHEGYFDEKGKPVKDSKTKEVKPAPDPEWLLFLKCMKGDTSDNVFSAYPGVRVKGTKNKVGLQEAFADRNNKGWAWNNLMLQRWVDHNNVEHRVLDDYKRNVILCDLKQQPDNIKLEINKTISEEIKKEKNIPQVGTHLLKFCSTHELTKVAEQIQNFTIPLNAKYNQ